MKNYIKNKIRPNGWLKTQLEIQAKGLSGNLDKVWPDVRDSAWIGGTKEDWERVPYWLDGFIPLAFLLENEDMIARAERYVTAILDRQEPDGWICPCSKEARSKYDIWALILISKVLTLYCEFTDSERAKKALYDAMKLFYELLKNEEIKLFEWGKYRWFEAFISLKYLYDTYNEEWIITLGRLLREKGVDYCGLTEEWKTPKNEWTLYTHIVNLAMMLKYEAVTSDLFNEEYVGKAEKLWEILEKHNGTAVGSFTGDECLSGLGNNQGTELCSVVELMYSCETLYEYTGNQIWADRLEKLAFNALPATISDDMWTHQYDQQVNQIGCVKMEKPIFRTNNGEAHLFGLEPHFGCCTSNFNQGWPKLCLNAFLIKDNVIICPVMLPASLETEINGVKVKITSKTEYPFRFTGEYTVETDREVEFTLKIRIPQWAKGKGNDDFCVFSKKWNGSKSFEISFTDKPKLFDRENGLKYAKYGPLIFSLPIETEYKMYEYEKDNVERKFPYCDYELYSKSEWRYGFADSSFEPCIYDGDEIPFSSKNPRITLKSFLARVEWDFEEGFSYVSAKLPKNNIQISETEIIELIPYGCAKLRMTEMPLLTRNTDK